MEGWYLLAPGTAAAGAGLTVMALCSEHWTRNSEGYAGLWTGCSFVESLQKWYCGPTHWQHAQYVTAVKVLVIMSVALGVITAVTSALAVVQKSFKWTYWSTLLVFLQDIILATGLFTFLGYIVKYGSRHDLSWSYSLGWISVGLYVLSIIFFIQQANRLRIGSSYENINGV